jgi:hypothetical protein
MTHRGSGMMNRFIVCVAAGAKTTLGVVIRNASPFLI